MIAMGLVLAVLLAASVAGVEIDRSAVSDRQAVEQLGHLAAVTALVVMLICLANATGVLR